MGLRETTRCLLSGGAVPLNMHDDPSTAKKYLSPADTLFTRTGSARGCEPGMERWQGGHREGHGGHRYGRTGDPNTPEELK